MIAKRRIMVGLPAAAGAPADKWVWGCALPPVSWKIHLLEYVGRFGAPRSPSGNRISKHAASTQCRRSFVHAASHISES
jgi:hypothetical protein